MDFKRITIDTISARLHELTQAEQIDVEERALRYVAKADRRFHARRTEPAGPVYRISLWRETNL